MRINLPFFLHFSHPGSLFKRIWHLYSLSSLKWLIIGGIAFLTLFPLFLYALVLNWLNTWTAARFDQTIVDHQLTMILNTVDYQANALARQAIDYARWDDMYRIASKPDPRWLEDNLVTMAATFKLDVVLLFNQQGEMVYQYGKPLPLTPIIKLLAERSAFSQPADSSNSGLLALPDSLLLFGFAPVYHTDSTGPQNGVFFIGQFIDQHLMQNLSPLNSNVMFAWHYRGKFIGPLTSKETSTNPKKLPSPSAVLNAAYSRKQKPADNTITFNYQDIPCGIKTVQDALANPAGELMVLHPYSYLSELIKINRILLPIFTLGVLPVAFLTYYFFHQTFLRPLVSLEQNIRRMEQEKRFYPVPVQGVDTVAALAAAFNHMVATISHHLEREKEYLQKLAHTDGLTGLYNYRYFQEKLQEQLKELSHTRGKHALCLILVDINYLKLYNQYCSLQDGDKLLQKVANLLAELAEPQGWAARLSGDNFALVVITEEGKNLTLVTEVTGKIKAAVQSLELPGREKLPGGSFSVSTGYACWPQEAIDKERLIELARQRLLLAKQMGPERLLRFMVEDANYYQELINAVDEQLLNHFKTILALIDAADKYTYGHTLRVEAYTMQLASKLNYPYSLKELQLAALLHDIGKTEIGGEILRKKAPLTPEEWQIMRQHPVWGADLIRPFPRLYNLIPLVLHHHERYDGTGYPFGLKGKEIPLGARIIAVADAFDAMTTNRPYRNALSIKEAASELQKGAGSQFDPEIVAAFLEILAEDQSLMFSG